MYACIYMHVPKWSRISHYVHYIYQRIFMKTNEHMFSDLLTWIKCPSRTVASRFKIAYEKLKVAMIVLHFFPSL